MTCTPSFPLTTPLHNNSCVAVANSQHAVCALARQLVFYRSRHRCMSSNRQPPPASVSIRQQPFPERLNPTPSSPKAYKPCKPTGNTRLKKQPPFFSFRRATTGLFRRQQTYVALHDERNFGNGRHRRRQHRRRQSATVQRANGQLLHQQNCHRHGGIVTPLTP